MFRRDNYPRKIKARLPNLFDTSYWDKNQNRGATDPNEADDLFENHPSGTAYNLWDVPTRRVWNTIQDRIWRAQFKARNPHATYFMNAMANHFGELDILRERWETSLHDPTLAHTNLLVDHASLLTDHNDLVNRYIAIQATVDQQLGAISDLTRAKDNLARRLADEQRDYIRDVENLRGRIAGYIGRAEMGSGEPRFHRTNAEASAYAGRRRSVTGEPSNMAELSTGPTRSQSGDIRFTPYMATEPHVRRSLRNKRKTKPRAGLL